MKARCFFGIHEYREETETFHLLGLKIVWVRGCCLECGKIQHRSMTDKDGSQLNLVMVRRLVFALTK